MPARRTDPDAPRSDGWTAAALLVLLGIALATDYFFPENETTRVRGREKSLRRSPSVPLHSTDGVGTGKQTVDTPRLAQVRHLGGRTRCCVSTGAYQGTGSWHWPRA